MPRLVVAHFRWFTLAWWDLNSTARFERPVSLVWADRINRTIWKNHSAIALRVYWVYCISSRSWLYQDGTQGQRFHCPRAVLGTGFAVCIPGEMLRSDQYREGLVGHSDSGADTARQFGWDASAIPGFFSSSLFPALSLCWSVLICVDLVLFVVWPSPKLCFTVPSFLFEALRFCPPSRSPTCLSVWSARTELWT